MVLRVTMTRLLLNFIQYTYFTKNILIKLASNISIESNDKLSYMSVPVVEKCWNVKSVSQLIQMELIFYDLPHTLVSNTYYYHYNDDEDMNDGISWYREENNVNMK